ncbi:MAG TPA: hypothetical protein VGE59_03330 [Patescibacteria group bacterium]
MKQPLFNWIVYEIQTESSVINGVMLRGRIRKLGLEKGFNVLVENAQDQENTVRFATLSKEDAETISTYIHSVINDASVSLVLESLANPVLSKLKVNIETRYNL